MSTVVTTSGGVAVARGNDMGFLAAQVRGLTSRSYPAFVKREGTSVEIVHGTEWSATGVSVPPWARNIVDILNETEPTKEGDQ